MIEPLDLRTGINTCMKSYMKRHKGNFPEHVSINESSYLELNTERLLTPAVDDNGKRYLNHESSKKIEVHLIANFPEKIRNELEKIIGCMNGVCPCDICRKLK